MNLSDLSDELYHYGVLGMKWGVRKDRYARKFSKRARKLAKIDAKLAKNDVHAKMDTHARAVDEALSVGDKKRAKKEAVKYVVARRQLQDAMYKGYKQVSKMERISGKVKWSDVSTSDLKRGEAWTKTMIKLGGKPVKPYSPDAAGYLFGVPGYMLAMTAYTHAEAHDYVNERRKGAR